MPKTPRNRANGGAIEVSGAIGGGASKLKKKIRDIQRLLKKENLGADVRIENERALKGLNVELQNTQLNLKAKDISKKYHMVRFFEKKKAIRKLKQSKKQLEEVTKTDVKKDIKKARRLVKHGEIDLAYVMMFPKTEKYISLYPNPKENDEVDMSNPKAKKGTQLTEQRRREFRKEVEGLMDDGKLPFSIEDAARGKNVTIETRNQVAVMEQEIDAPEQKKDSKEDDDFFE